ncbi:MAG TPA: cytochrome C oxidase subunit IV family protein [Acidimicrobiia bacterium]|jgi:cytochrome c oxidase subunit 4
MADDAATPTGTATEEPQPSDAERSGAGEPGTALEPAAEAAPPARPEQQQVMLPGEIRPHPQPARYVMIAAVLVVVTAAEVGLFYLQGDIPDGLITVLLLTFALIKFSLVASWYMHLRTDKPIFRRFFVLGIVAAISLYLIVLTTLHVWGSS